MPNHRTPANLKIARRGKVGDDDAPDDEVQPIGPPPDWLGEEAAAAYDRVVALAPKGMLTACDGPIVEMYGQCYAEWLACQRAIRSDGLILTTLTERGEVRKAHPLLPASNQLAKQMADILSRCGMTPAGRATIGVVEDGKKDGLLQFLRSRDGKAPAKPKPRAKPRPPRAPRRPSFPADPMDDAAG